MKSSSWCAILILGAALTSPLIAQRESTADQRSEQQADQMAQQNRAHEPHMAAALEHLRQAQEELEKATPNKGGHRERAMQLVRQAQTQVEQGIEYYNQHEKRKR